MQKIGKCMTEKRGETSWMIVSGNNDSFVRHMSTEPILYARQSILQTRGGGNDPDGFKFIFPGKKSLPMKWGFPGKMNFFPGKMNFCPRKMNFFRKFLEKGTWWMMVSSSGDSCVPTFAARSCSCWKRGGNKFTYLFVHVYIYECVLKCIYIKRNLYISRSAATVACPHSLPGFAVAGRGEEINVNVYLYAFQCI